MTKTFCKYNCNNDKKKVEINSLILLFYSEIFEHCSKYSYSYTTIIFNINTNSFTIIIFLYVQDPEWKSRFVLTNSCVKL